MTTKNVILSMKVMATDITAALVNLEADFQLSGNAEGMWLYTARDDARKLVEMLDSLESAERLVCEQAKRLMKS